MIALLSGTGENVKITLFGTKRVQKRVIKRKNLAKFFKNKPISRILYAKDYTND